MPYRDREKQNIYRRDWYRRNAAKERQRIAGIRTRLRTGKEEIAYEDEYGRELGE